MRFLYIDDSYLRSFPFVKTLQGRLFSFCRSRDVTHILLSGLLCDDGFAKMFYEECRKAKLTVIHSPASLSIGDHQGYLNHTSLFIQDVGNYEVRNGCAVYGDSDTNQFYHVYFNLFLSYDLHNVADQLEEKLNELLHDLLNQNKKSNHYH